MMVTGVPRGNSSASWSTTSLGTRMQPWETSRPMLVGSFVPWMAIWPLPPPNSDSVSE